jgi:hypothetical protein
MFHKKPSFLLLLIFFFNINYSNAEDIKKIKYGKVTMEELQMTRYDQDTSADAVVLYQYAEFDPLQFKFYQHIRIKVLKKSGTSTASMIFNDKLKYAIKGCTYNLENGEIVKTKLVGESVFEERVVGDIFRTRIAMPNVKVGSVFEISVGQDGIPFAYEIQRNIPIIYGAIYFPQSPNVDIRINEIGYLGYAFKGDNKWIIKDLPSFVNEPFITSENDFRVRMDFELLSFKIVNIYNYNVTLFASFAANWKDVTKLFLANQYFGIKIDDFSFHFDKLADSLKSISSNEDELVKNVYEVIKKIKWNGLETCFTSQFLKKSYELKQGNSADINLNLVVLLKKVGLKSYPVLFSTRSHGRISKFSPTVVKFNYVLAAVDLSSGTKYLDATNEFYPYDLASETVSCCLGHPVNYGKPECSVFIEPIKKHKKTSFSNFNIDSTGIITGTISIKRYDYNAVDFKNKLKSKPDHDSYISEFEANNSGWHITDYAFNNLDNPYKEFVDEYKVNFGSSLGINELLIFNPLSFVFDNQNPFQKDKRYLPISFPYLTEYSSVVSISLPSNYQVSQLPKDIDISNNSKSARYTYQVVNNGTSITISTSFLINKLKYETYEYPSLRGLYELMLKKQNESIVLKKI